MRNNFNAKTSYLNRINKPIYCFWVFVIWVILKIVLWVFVTSIFDINRAVVRWYRRLISYFSKTHDVCYSIEGARNTDRDRCDVAFNQNMKMVCKYTTHGVPDASCAAMNFLIYDKCKDFCSIGWYNSVATCSLRWSFNILCTNHLQLI